MDSATGPKALIRRVKRAAEESRAETHFSPFRVRRILAATGTLCPGDFAKNSEEWETQMKRVGLLAAGLALAVAFPAAAQQAKPAEVSVKVHKIDDKGMGDLIGRVYFKDGPKGLIVSPRLKGLPPGDHGFHVHENRNCGPKAGADGKMVPGLAAGGHYDPDKTGKHEGPEGKGHLGDLPALKVAADGSTSGSMVAPRLKVSDLRGRSLVIHAGGDNYSDQPAPLGGGGARIACGLF